MSKGIYRNCSVCDKLFKQSWDDYYSGVLPVCSEECDIYGASEADDDRG